MAVQGDELVMIGRGVSNGDVVNPVGRPALANGIHLRYAFKRDKGFPWYGYYLFRRAHVVSKPICVYPPLRGGGVGLSTQWSGPHGTFSASGAGLVLGEAFAPSAQPEFDLRNSPSLRFTPPAGTVVREFRVTLGIYGTKGNPVDPSTTEPAGCLVAPFVAISRLIRNIFRPSVKKVGPIRVTAYHEGVAMAQHDIYGVAGEVVTATLTGDALDAVEVSTGGAAVALIEVCYIPVSADMRQGWTPLTDFTYPMCLPSAQSGYPCANRPASPSQAFALAQGRVRYGPVSDWDAARFADLTVYLDAMLNNGPAGGAMAGRNGTVAATGGTADDPQMPSLYPLDMLLFGSLEPSVAQVLGLYWVDQTAQPGTAYDYIVLADHDNSFQGSAQAALTSLVAGTLSIDVDAWITYNQRLGQAPVLAAPADLRGYALPGGTVASTETVAPSGTNTAGLTWALPETNDGGLLPDSAIYYHLWRNGPLATAPSSAPAAGSLITADTPVLVADSEIPAGAQIQFAADWPPFRLHAYDRHLPDGWYSYRVAGVDIFGQYTPLSSPARWYQWQPLPEPRPWYYNGAAPGSDSVVNSLAVCLRDTTPPPSPPGVEAWALDPEDPLLIQDSAFSAWMAGNWWNQVAPQATRIGVRVRWRWTAVQQLQAPDTAEFRLYFHPGSTLPAPDGRDPLNWEARIFTVPYANHASHDAQTGERIYDVLLPLTGNAPFGGLPLAPGNASPVVYGHIGVSASDDKATTSDHIRWQTSAPWQVSALGGRTGNEGRLGVPAKIYRVLRAPPPAPILADTRDKAWASRADYHGHSSFTFRWPKPPVDAGLIDVHILSAMDETLFAFDFAQRPRQAFNMALLAAFPAGWDAAAIKSELDGLNSPLLTTLDAALPLYKGLSDRSLRVLASLPTEAGGKPGNDGAFRQLTYAPLKHTEAAQADRTGPDDEVPYTPVSSLCAFTAQLDGRARNRYFFRAAYVNGAHNPGQLGPSSPPVYLHKVEPPRTPVVTKVLGGDRQIILTFASNREDDLAEYRIYRADSERQASDLRLMTLVATVPESAAPPARPGAVVFTDPVPAGPTFSYCVAAVDTSGNVSPPSPAISARAVDTVPPASPLWVSAAWVMYDPGTQTSLPWPSPAIVPAPYIAAVRLELTSSADLCRIVRRPDGQRPWISVTETAPVNGQVVAYVTDVLTSERMSYRALAVNALGVRSTWSSSIAVEAI